jgi:hypothetical protein
MSLTQFPKIDQRRPPVTNIVYLDNGLAIFTVPSNPDGVVIAAPGSFAIDAEGHWYKNSGAGPSTWDLVAGGGAISLPLIYPVNTKQVFSPGAINAGMNVGQVGTDPATLVNGDVWYNTTTGQLKTFANGQTSVIAPIGTVGKALTPNFARVYATVANQLMHQYTLPPATLANDNDYAEYNFAGNIANNTNPKSIRMQMFGLASHMFNFAPLSIVGWYGDGGGGNVTPIGWKIHGTLARLTNTTYAAEFILYMGMINPSNQATLLDAVIMPRSCYQVTYSPGFTTNPFTIGMYGITTNDNEMSQYISTCKVYNF